ncbi:glycosyltransferase family 4 protein [Granulosicoccus sp. 3-233]|uniref:glycosyltransferase family 4 protein n=1 Tax=Granulosicoccus sp. 3-233 TaxID=3417969 RepID=UPI003D32B429
MHVWLVKLEDPLPADEGFRAYRMHMLAEALVKRGHKVTRWCSDFDHQNLENRFGGDAAIDIAENYHVRLLHSPVVYTKRVSLARLINNWILASKFRRVAAKTQERPDIIVCSMPTPALAAASVKVARQFNVPAVVDARDLWPDIISDELSLGKRLLAAPVLSMMKREITYAASNATGLVGITSHYRDHLLKYASRSKGPEDSYFYIGYEQPPCSEGATGTDTIKAFLSESFQYIFYFAGRMNSTVANAIDPVISAARQLQSVAPDVAFVMCGDGDQLESLKSRTTDLSNIVWPGKLSQPALAQLKSRATAGLLPIERRRDYQISLSNKIFEYMNAGLPILSFLDGVPADVIREHNCGMLYDDGDELVRCVMRLKDDTVLRESMCEASRSVFASTFTANAVYGSFSDYLERLSSNYLRKYN